MDIALAYCTTGNVRHRFMLSVVALTGLRDPHVSRLAPAEVAYIEDGRNLSARAFLEGPEEWCLSLDTDIVFRDDMPGRIRDVAVEHGPGVYAGLYVAPLPLFDLSDPENPTAELRIMPVWRDADNEQVTVSPPEDAPLVELAVCGMGFTFVHRKVVEDIRDAYGPDDIDWWCFGRDIIDGRRAGEDVTFCHRARELGYKVWGVPSVRVGHEKTTLLLPEG